MATDTDKKIKIITWLLNKGKDSNFNFGYLVVAPFSYQNKKISYLEFDPSLHEHYEKFLDKESKKAIVIEVDESNVEIKASFAWW
ncbi:hypothetical protein [endosymbiont GvMRE of Glomus versiforme]|uniref:hypothetical protein n=1 Tax=endosymbiont GvMRE of Glomus versiforme TaxID=2039283 RepID=UPI000EC7C939|nr:hypothetical protein [endosymbiont GvMRE of Glomus versiforme]RHZ36008.1 hypothetical protein GvMRE_Ic3g62 [endosymbiont GvMRE of Glomus versiforme]